MPHPHFGESLEFRKVKILSNTFARINEDAAAEVSYMLVDFLSLASNAA